MIRRHIITKITLHFIGVHKTQHYYTRDEEEKCYANLKDNTNEKQIYNDEKNEAKNREEERKQGNSKGEEIYNDMLKVAPLLVRGRSYGLPS
eukprot:3108941-Heterocapsa_arctica.AAC.1